MLETAEVRDLLSQTAVDSVSSYSDKAKAQALIATDSRGTRSPKSKGVDSVSGSPDKTTTRDHVCYRCRLTRQSLTYMRSVAFAATAAVQLHHDG